MQWICRNSFFCCFPSDSTLKFRTCEPGADLSRPMMSRREPTRLNRDAQRLHIRAQRRPCASGFAEHAWFLIRCIAVLEAYHGSAYKLLYLCTLHVNHVQLVRHCETPDTCLLDPLSPQGRFSLVGSRLLIMGLDKSAPGSQVRNFNVESEGKQQKKEFLQIHCMWSKRS